MTMQTNESNSLNTIRFLASIKVLFMHTLAHLNIVTTDFNITKFDANNTIVIAKWILLNLFTGLPLFYAISGYFMWLSIRNSNSFLQYLKKRFWRIYPELWFAVAIELIVLLLLYNKPVNWLDFGIFAVTQSTIFQFWTPDSLKGYGCGCPNGSLWTIGIFIQFYFVVYFVHKKLHSKSKVVWLTVVLLSMLVAYISFAFEDKISSNMLFKLYKNTFIPYFWIFMLGAVAAEYKEKILPFCKKFFGVFLFLAAFLALIGFDVKLHYRVFNTILLFLGWLGFGYVLPQFKLKTDLSYGIYLYHMTVINAFIMFGKIKEPYYIVMVIILSCIMSWISAKTIGRWAADRKKKMVTNNL